jgi:transglutaminase-like putative cysteine protease
MLIFVSKIMTSLTIRHITTYRYQRAVAFGEHRMMLRPRDAHDQRVLGIDLEISPEPKSLRFVEDPFGNHVAVAQFSARSSELRFESTVSLEHFPTGVVDLAVEGDGPAFPPRYSAEEKRDLVAYFGRDLGAGDDEVGRWALQFVPEDCAIGPVDLLSRLSKEIKDGFTYRRREAKGIQRPAETLRLGMGTCRDFAALMIDAARRLGYAARFASGYLAILDDGTDAEFGGFSHGSTHAWAQIFLPGIGWVDFDPTNGSVGKAALITVAVVRDPLDATPLHGTFFGAANDHIGMEVQVMVRAGAPQ